MTWGFERGRIYNRKNDIHGPFGGQPQGGIITPADAAVVIAITGEKGIGHGYDDRELPDKTFEYFGAGRFGPMTLSDRNKGLLEHSQKGKSLLLFRDEKRQRLRFLGEYVCDGFEWRDAPDENKQIRPAIVFKLVPLDKITETIDEDLEGGDTTKRPLSDLSLEELRKLAQAASKPSVPGTPRVGTVYERSRIVRAYVLARAKGLCEYEKKPAPFLREDGEPYLEPHHIERLSDGGPDDPKSVIALCPNCHRRAHSGAKKLAFKAELVGIMKTIERT
jgi:5-methylcytosine-specific restriction protein A